MMSPQPLTGSPPLATLFADDPHLASCIESWLSIELPQKVQQSIQRIRTLKEEDPQRLADCFAGTLTFGTGGLRGLMDVGPNRMNEVTVAKATQGLCEYLNSQDLSKQHQVAIAYDSRQHSKSFAQTAARVLAANGIRVLLFKDLRPLPQLAYTLKQQNCDLGIMITASHNPPAYNGYKVFGPDGAQILSPIDQEILKNMQQVSTWPMAALTSPLIEILSELQDQSYLQEVNSHLLNEKSSPHTPPLRVIYSPLHGTGGTLFPQLLKRSGFCHCEYVESQKDPNPLFPTVDSPNPGEVQALKAGIHQLKLQEADIFLATDPDADRLGVVALRGLDCHVFTGNELACMLAYYILSSLKKKSQLPANGAIVKSLVTTPLVSVIAKDFSIPCFEVYTGFKYIGEKIRLWEANKKQHFLFGCEESYGYLHGTHMGDKDALEAGLLIAELAFSLKKQGKTLIDYLENIHMQYGYDDECLIELKLSEGQKGLEEKHKLMQALRKQVPKKLQEHKLCEVHDFLNCLCYSYPKGQEKNISLPSNDMLQFLFDTGLRIIIRPSGTEPKVKVYFSRLLDPQSSTAIQISKATPSKAISSVWEEMKGLYNIK